MITLDFVMLLLNKVDSHDVWRWFIYLKILKVKFISESILSLPSVLMARYMSLSLRSSRATRSQILGRDVKSNCMSNSHFGDHCFECLKLREIWQMKFLATYKFGLVCCGRENSFVDNYFPSMWMSMEHIPWHKEISCCISLLLPAIVDKDLWNGLIWLVGNFIC